MRKRGGECHLQQRACETSYSLFCNSDHDGLGNKLGHHSADKGEGRTQGDQHGEQILTEESSSLEPREETGKDCNQAPALGAETAVSLARQTSSGAELRI